MQERKEGEKLTTAQQMEQQMKMVRVGLAQIDVEPPTEFGWHVSNPKRSLNKLTQEDYDAIVFDATIQITPKIGVIDQREADRRAASRASASWIKGDNGDSFVAKVMNAITPQSVDEMLAEQREYEAERNMNQLRCSDFAKDAVGNHPRRKRVILVVNDRNFSSLNETIDADLLIGAALSPKGGDALKAMHEFPLRDGRMSDWDFAAIAVRLANGNGFANTTGHRWEIGKAWEGTRSFLVQVFQKESGSSSRE